MKAVLEGDYLPAPISRPVFNESADDNSIGAEMTDYYRYIDTRLADIEQKLDIRMAAMQRFQEQADARVERQIKEAETRLERQAKEAEARMGRAVNDVKADSKITRVTVVTTAAGSVIALGGLVAAIVFSFQTTVSEQGAWLRQSVDRIEQRVDTSPISAPEAETPPSE